ncbi:MAG: PKD domain-containing protein, partial [Thermoplasmata archaeon]
MKKIATMSVFAILLLSSAIAVSEPATEPSARLEDPLGPQPMPDMIKIWEAYAKGWAQITSEVNQYGYPSVFRVTNSGSIKVNINEMMMLLSPHPLESWNPQTTQDGALTSAVVDPYSYLDYEYGDGAPPGSIVWWCTEHRQWTQYGATIFLGGEIMPYALQEIAQGPNPTNDEIWDYLDLHPTLVVGKTPLWKNVEDAINHNITITLTVTNLAIYGPGVTNPPHAVNSVIEDTIPMGYSYVPGSIVPAPDAVVGNPDGSQTIRWKVNVSAADVSFHDDLTPTPYHTVLLSYTLVTPKLLAGRYFLPRAYADVDHDGSNDSHSAKPLIEVYRVNKPPVANAGGPYEVDEGADILLDAGGSSDPNGDLLKYRWDLDDDGAWDTSWSSLPV